MLLLWETMMSIRRALGGRESTNPDKTFSTPSSENLMLPDGSLLGVEGARGSGDAAPGISQPPAKTPCLDSGLLKKHPHPMPVQESGLQVIPR